MTNYAVNRKASYDYHIEEKYEAGIVLKGSEVKSIREGKINLKDGYCVFRGDELFLINVHISPYKPAASLNHEPERSRKLLLKKAELEKLKGRLEQKGYALIPLRVYSNSRGKIKVEIALVRGKKKYDKRETIKKRIIEREMARETKYQ